MDELVLNVETDNVDAIIHTLLKNGYWISMKTDRTTREELQGEITIYFEKEE